ncbi:FAD-dependent monooxygenase [Actinomadura sp. NPDC048032]|uniref:FAD-dependent monooxygenase n=1 Tax=Actinomadura sp. NPDC048032 TaxID=3155747 RepID=UPI0033FE2393
MDVSLIVVGGGIGGIATALACARQGMKVRVLERASEFGEVGAGLQVGPNAWRILRDLGVVDGLREQVVLPTRWEMIDIYTGETISALRFGTEFTERYRAPYAVVHRGELLTALLEACQRTGRVHLIPGTEVVSVSQDEDSATVQCADGSTHTGTAIVAADGLRSVVRRQLLDDRPPLVSPYVVYRGPGPRPADVDDAVMLYVGDGIHYMQYPVSGGTVLNRVVSFRSTAGEPGSAEWGTPEELHRRFAGTIPHVRSAVAELDLSKRWPLCDRPPLAGWAQGRITLLGDAAHPMQQYLAQGACQALEDAIALSDALRACPGDPAAAFKSFENIRFPRVSSVQELTRFIGDFCHLGGAAVVLRDHFLSGLGASDHYAYTDWLYGGPAKAPVLPPSIDMYAGAATEVC